MHRVFGWLVGYLVSHSVIICTLWFGILGFHEVRGNALSSWEQKLPFKKRNALHFINFHKSLHS